MLASQGSVETDRTILVVGDMLELGGEAEMFHKRLGAEARSAGITDLWAIGVFADSIVKSFGAGGVSYDQIEDVSAECVKAAQPGVIFLAKGSRGSRMERVVDVLMVTDN